MLGRAAVLGCVHRHAAAVEEGAEGAGQDRHDRDRVGLKQDVEHARRRRDEVGSWDETVVSCVLVQNNASPTV